MEFNSTLRSKQTHMHNLLLPLGKLFKSIINFSLNFIKAFKNYLLIIRGGALGATETHTEFLAACPGHRGCVPCHGLPGSWEPRPAIRGRLMLRAVAGRGQDGDDTAVCGPRAISSVCSC